MRPGRLLVLPLLLCALARAEEAWRLTSLGVEDGLSHNSVYSIHQDRLGFLWIGTVDGLNRWDGSEFLVFRHDPGDAGSLPSPIVRALAEDPEGVLLVGTDAGLAAFDRATRRFTRIPLGTGSRPPLVHSLLRGREGDLWAATDQGLFHRRPGAGVFVARPLATRPAAAWATCLAEDPAGRTWVLTAGTEGSGAALHLLRTDGVVEAPWVVDESWGFVWSFRFARDGTLWMSPAGPARLDEGSRRVVAPPGSAARGLASAVLSARDGSVYIGTSAGLCIARGGGSAADCRLLKAEGVWLQNFVRTLHEDRTGAVWIGGYTGLHRYDPKAKPFRVLRHDRLDPQSLSSSAVSAILEAEDGKVLLGTFGGGLNEVDLATGRARRFRREPGDPRSLCDDVVWSLARDPEGTVWIGTENGLCRRDRATGAFSLVKLPFPADPRSGRRVWSVCVPGRTVYAAGPTGLYAYVPATGAASAIESRRGGGAFDSSIESLLPAGEGALWAGSGRIGLRRLDVATGRFEDRPLLSAQGRPLPSEGIWTLVRGSAGRLWIGSGAGLHSREPESGAFRHWGVAQGLPGSLVYSILEEREGRLWLGTSRGLVRFDEVPGGTARFRLYDTSDGVAGMELNRGAVARLESGEVLFGGVDGVTLFDPSAIRDDLEPPPVVLTRLEKAGPLGTVSLDPSGLTRVDLTFREVPFAFEFAALSFANPSRNRYSYRLVGVDPDWVDAGGRRFARYAGVHPGRYVFRVRASNHDGAWNLAGASVVVVVTPPWWSTWWFLSLAAACAVGLAVLAYRARIRRLLEMERLRLAIAGDLHDDLSSDLSGIALTADLLRRSPALGEAERSRLDEVRDRALGMVDAVRDTVWAVNPEHDNFDALVRRMRGTAQALLGERPFTLRVAPELSGGAAGMALRRTLYLAFKEALHNVARHSGATRVEAWLAAGAERVELGVVDDGRGFDPSARSDGEGLRSLARRAAEGGGTFAVESRPGGGTTLRLSVPLTKTRYGRGARAGRSLRRWRAWP